MKMNEPNPHQSLPDENLPLLNVKAATKKQRAKEKDPKEILVIFLIMVLSLLTKNSHFGRNYYLDYRAFSSGFELILYISNSKKLGDQLLCCLFIQILHGCCWFIIRPPKSSLHSSPGLFILQILLLLQFIVVLMFPVLGWMFDKTNTRFGRR